MKYRNFYIIAAVFLVFGMAVQIVTAYQRASDNVQERLELQMQVAQDKLTLELYDAYDAQKEMEAFDSENLRTPTDWLSETHRIMKYFPALYTCFVAYPPYALSDSVKWCGLTSYRSDDSIITVTFGDEQHDYFQREWYKGAVASGKTGYWTEPYIDEDFDEPIFTYSHDLRDQNDSLICIIGLDFSLRWLQQLLLQYKPFPQAALVLYSSSGECLAGSNIIEDNHRWVSSRKILDPMGIDLVMAMPRKYIWQRIGQGIAIPLMVFVLSIVVVVFFIRRMMRDQKENVRLGTELNLASQIQQSMLPYGELNAENINIKAFLKPAREVGGDLYDYSIRDQMLFFCIGDVSGKGAPAALLMAVTHTLFQSACALETDPAAIMQTINRALCRDNRRNMFVTLFIGVLHSNSGRLLYANAGHEKTIHLRPNEPKHPIRYIPSDANLPVGVFEDTQYTTQETILVPGDILLLYTDGLTEAKNSTHEQFGLKRMEQVISDQLSDISCQQVIRDITEAVRTFVGNAEQSDDITILAIEKTHS